MARFDPTRTQLKLTILIRVGFGNASFCRLEVKYNK